MNRHTEHGIRGGARPAFSRLIGLSLSLVLLLFSGAAPAAGEDCDCGWQTGFAVNEFDGEVVALEVFDDGSGPALYAGGSFVSVSGQVVNRIAKWDGVSWTPLSGPDGTGVPAKVEGMAVFDDGSGPALYVGGRFETAGGVTVGRIARWDGTEWSALEGSSGIGVDGGPYGRVDDLEVFDDGTGPALYVAGQFSEAGGLTANYIARWDGSEWSVLSGPSGTGTSGQVYELEVFDDGGGDALYAAGYYPTAGGVAVHNIARWDGTNWSALGSGTDERVLSLLALDGVLYAGGDLETAGGVQVNHVAAWDGTTWSALTGSGGTGTNDRVSGLFACDTGSGAQLYAGGLFTSAGGVAVDRIATWDGSEWSGLPGGGANDKVIALASYDSGDGEELIAAGAFTAAGGAPANRLARRNDSEWSVLPGPQGQGIEGTVVYALGAFDGVLYAAGDFEATGGESLNKIGRWNGNAWAALSNPTQLGTMGKVDALATFDDGAGEDLYAAGSFYNSSDPEPVLIATWDGSSWIAIPQPAIDVYWLDALAVFDDGTGSKLYAGGWDNSDETFAVAWDGSDWTVLPALTLDPPGDTPGDVARIGSLVVYDDGSGSKLYACGHFDAAGGTVVNNIAAWDGTSWTPLQGPLGTGVENAHVYSMVVHDDGSGAALVVGGSFYSAGGVPADFIARWDGSDWTTLPGLDGTGFSSSVYTFAVHEGLLFAGGNFTSVGGVQVDHVAYWDGATWRPLGRMPNPGTDQSVESLLSFDDGTGQALWIGGYFRTAGNVASMRIAKWSTLIFGDGFESAGTGQWDRTVD